jgi:hypothetical protein
MSVHSNTLSWYWAIQSLLSLLNIAYLVEKQPEGGDFCPRSLQLYILPQFAAKVTEGGDLCFSWCSANQSETNFFMGGQHALFQVFVFMPFFSSLDLAEGTTVWTGGNDIDVWTFVLDPCSYIFYLNLLPRLLKVHVNHLCIKLLYTSNLKKIVFSYYGWVVSIHTCLPTDCNFNELALQKSS